MSEHAIEHTEHTEHTEHETPASDDIHVGERLGSHDARLTALEEQVRTLASAQASTEEDVERVEDEAERAEERAIDASIEASQAEQTAEVAEAVAVAAAEVAVEAEETAEEVEEEVAGDGDSGEVTEVEASEEPAPSEAQSTRRRRRGLYGRR